MDVDRIWAGLGALALACTAACSEPAGFQPPEPLPPRDLTMLALMQRINAPYLGMQPELRNSASLELLADAAAEIVSAAEDPDFVAWASRDDFTADRTIWDASYTDLLEGARTARGAARAGDLDTLHEAYGRMSRSCTACHKRYSPHQ